METLTCPRCGDAVTKRGYCGPCYVMTFSRNDDRTTEPHHYHGLRFGKSAETGKVYAYHTDRKTPDPPFTERPDRKPWEPKPHDDVTIRRMPGFSVPSAEMRPGFNGQKVGRNPAKPRNPHRWDAAARRVALTEARRLCTSDLPNMESVHALIHRLEKAGEIPKPGSPGAQGTAFARLYQWAFAANDKPKRKRRRKPSGDLFKREKTAKSAIGFELLK